MRNSVPQGYWDLQQPDLNLKLLVNQTRSVLNQREHIKTTVQTDDAAPTDIWAETMPTNRAWSLDYLLIGRDTVGNVARYHEACLIKRASAGATIVATDAQEVAYEDVAAWGFTVTAGADGLISIAVIGDVATTIKWLAYIEVREA